MPVLVYNMLPRDEPEVHFENLTHRTTAEFLKNAANTGKLGAGPPEPDPSVISSVVTGTAISLFHTFPWGIMAFQFVWSSIVTVIAFLVGWFVTSEGSRYTLSGDFWSGKSRVYIASDIVYALGWAMFVLLGLFVAEASDRFHDAQSSIFTVGSQLSYLLRKIRQCYPAGTWHPGDLDRIIAHLVAYPVALKMTLRQDRSPEQLLPILHEKDVNDVVNADIMHVHCLRVVRAYLSVAEEDGVEFNLSDTDSTPAGAVIRRIITKFTDDIDAKASVAARIAEFKPSLAYINHLRILLHVWLLFLPLNLAASCGW